MEGRARHEPDVARLLMAIGMVGTGVARRRRGLGADPAEHESQNDHPARRPGQRIGSWCSR